MVEPIGKPGLAISALCAITTKLHNSAPEGAESRHKDQKNLMRVTVVVAVAGFSVANLHTTGSHKVF